MKRYERKNAKQNQNKFYLTLFHSSLLFFVMLCISHLVTAQTRNFLDVINTKPTKNIIPYIEAEGQPSSSSRIIWLTPDKVSFTRQDSYNNNFVQKTIDGSTHHFDKIYSVVIFDTETGRTTTHHAGELWRYEDGILTIRLKKLYAGQSAEYEYQLKGPLGQEQPFTVDQSVKPWQLLPKQCPKDTKSEPTKKLMEIFLKPEHGCLKGPFSGINKDWVYFPVDGEQIKLDVLDLYSQDLFGPAIWIQWLDAYLMGDFVVKSNRSSGDLNSTINTSTLKLFKPEDGRLLIVPINEWSVINARPTRAGMVARWGPYLIKVFICGAAEILSELQMVGEETISKCHPMVVRLLIL